MTARDGDSQRGLSVFANFTAHDKATSRVDHFIQAGIVYEGPVLARKCPATINGHEPGRG
ncbi:carbohydrate porin [Pseudomonas gingeri]|uniref:carbohydrate porin n=1 Tax=Pseudomonas gingeri TaxID=117681 RepID=UPI003527593C